MSVFIAVKGIHVKNSGPKDLVISAPGGLNPTTLSYNQSGSFDVEGKYTGRYAGVRLPFSIFSMANKLITGTGELRCFQLQLLRGKLDCHQGLRKRPWSKRRNHRKPHLIVRVQVVHNTDIDVTQITIESQYHCLN